MRNYDLLITGAGAAGLMCAIAAGRRGLRALILERSEKPGKKILISGGGRCNFTNRTVSHVNFISSNPDFCRSALARYTPDDFIELVNLHGIGFHEKKLGQLFCNGSSREILQMLLKECKEAGAEIICSADIKEVKKNSIFEVKTDTEVLAAPSLVIASGGRSIPKIGATPFGYLIAEYFGHSIVNVRPGLVPLILKEEERKRFSNVSGLSVRCNVTLNGISFDENLLFTHKGLSGPAVLQASSYWNGSEPVQVNFLPDYNIADLISGSRQSRIRTCNFLSMHIPQRLAELILPPGIIDKQLNQISNSEIQMLSGLIHDYHFHPVNTEGFEKSEVTCGGVDTREISSKTMESEIVKGLYFAGEVMDVTGWLGGYNFQWAWSSGHAAGSAVGS